MTTAVKWVLGIMSACLVAGVIAIVAQTIVNAKETAVNTKAIEMQEKQYAAQFQSLKEGLNEVKSNQLVLMQHFKVQPAIPGDRAVVRPKAQNAPMSFIETRSE